MLRGETVGHAGSEAANKISFDRITELESGNLKIVFHLDKVALINSYALDDPSRIVIDLKNTSIKEPIESKFFAPIKLIRANEVGNSVRVVLDLKGSVYWKKPWQVKHKDRVDLILEIKRDRKISNNLRDIIVAIGCWIFLKTNLCVKLKLHLSLVLALKTGG